MGPGAEWQAGGTGTHVPQAPTVVLRLFAAARQAAGTGREEGSGRSVGEVLDAAADRHGAAFAQVLASSRVWVNGAPAQRDTALADGDEVAVLPPVSGGDGPWTALDSGRRA